MLGEYLSVAYVLFFGVKPVHSVMWNVFLLISMEDTAVDKLCVCVCAFRSDLMKFIQELRSSSGGSFASMSLQDVVGGVTQLILDHQVTGF